MGGGMLCRIVSEETTKNTEQNKTKQRKGGEKGEVII